MPWWRKSVRGFSLYSEELLNSRGTRWLIIVTHLICFLLGITAVIIGVFSYAQNTPGGATIQYVNCSLAIDLDSNIDFPLRLLLVLTGALLIAIDINISILLCFLKYCGCGGLAVVWYIIDCLVLVAWTAWALYYMVAVFPTWQDDRALCENFVMISTLVAVGVSCFFALLYLAVIVIVVCYESRQRLECCQSCCYRPKYRDSDY